jgi:hypothetical protein
MTAMPQLLFLFITCFTAPLNCSWTSPDRRDAVPARLMLGSQTEDSHCSSYISAYGVSVAQYQRIESNWKRFQSICRAPSAASVDFVVIFAHDTDDYKDTLPAPVHTDSSGFSDWSAIVTLDNTRPPEKYKHEYVWVFRFKRGTFVPGHFPTNAKPDYSEVESGAHNSDRAVDASFTFIASQKE